MEELAREDATTATQEEDKIIELEEVDADQAEMENQMQLSSSSPFELSLAQFITGLETNERNLLTVEHVTQVHAFVMAFVEQNTGDLGISWMQRFGDLLLQTMLVHIDTDLSVSKSKLLRDINSLLYDVLVVSDEEEGQLAQEQEEESVKPFESSLQWKDVIEEDVRKDVSSIEKAPLKKMDAVVDEIYRKLMIQNDEQAPQQIVSADDIILKLQDLLNQTAQ
jgi:hypothetical protein